MLRSLLSAADGVVGIDEVFQNAFLEEIPFWTTPSAPLKEASRLLLDVASTPPMSGGEWGAPQFIHTFYDRAGFVVQSPSPLRRGVCAMRRMLRSLHCAAACILLLGTSALAATQSGLADAAMKGDITAFRMLLQQHADVNAPQADGATALHWEVYRDDAEMTRLLL